MIDIPSQDAELRAQLDSCNQQILDAPYRESAIVQRLKQHYEDCLSDLHGWL
jgi:hypothetical protein